MDGQQAPELEVLDHRKLLQALRRGGGRTEVRTALRPRQDALGLSGLQGTPGQLWSFRPAWFPDSVQPGPRKGAIMGELPGLQGKARLPTCF